MDRLGGECLPVVPLDDLRPDPANPRRISDEELDALERRVIKLGPEFLAVALIGYGIARSAARSVGDRWPTPHGSRRAAWSSSSGFSRGSWPRFLPAWTYTSIGERARGTIGPGTLRAFTLDEVEAGAQAGGVSARSSPTAATAPGSRTGRSTLLGGMGRGTGASGGRSPPRQLPDRRPSSAVGGRLCRRGPHAGRRDRAEPLARPTREDASRGEALMMGRRDAGRRPLVGVISRHPVGRVCRKRGALRRHLRRRRRLASRR